MAALNGAYIRVDSDGYRVSDTEALVDRLRPEAEQRTMSTVVHGAAAFGIQLEQAGLVIARVSESEVADLKALREHEQRVTEADPSGRASGNRIDLCEAGDLVAVTRFGDVCRINADKTGLAVRLLDDVATTGALAARDALLTGRDEVGDVWLPAPRRSCRLGRATRCRAREPPGGRQHRTRRARRRLSDRGDDRRRPRRGGRFLPRRHAVLEGLFDFLVPGPRLTPLQAELANRAAEERAEARDFAEAERQRESDRDWLISKRTAGAEGSRPRTWLADRRAVGPARRAASRRLRPRPILAVPARNRGGGAGTGRNRKTDEAKRSVIPVTPAPSPGERPAWRFHQARRRGRPAGGAHPTNSHVLPAAARARASPACRGCGGACGVCGHGARASRDGGAGR